MTPGARLWAAVALFAVLASVYAFSVDLRASRGAAITGDEPFYLMTTQSLLQDGDLDLRQQYDRRSYRAFFDHPDGLWQQSVPTADGRVLSPHDLGLSVLVLPGFWLGGLRGVQVQLLLLAALTFTLAYVLSVRLTGAPAAAWAAALGLGVTATPFVYATEIYPEVPAALVLLAALLRVIPADGGAPAAGARTALVPAGARAAPVPAGARAPLASTGARAALVLCVLLSAMVWLGIKYAVPAGLVAGYFWVHAGRRGRITLLAAGAACAAVYVWFNLNTFGGLTPYAVNVVYAGHSTPEILAGHLAFVNRFYRLLGIWIDERFGVARWAPLVFAALPPLVWLARRPGPGRLLVGLVAAWLLVATFVAITMMGWWFPGRTLMTVLPLLVVPLTLLIRHGSAVVRGTVLVLALWSAAITAALVRAAHAGEVTLAVDPFAMQAPVFQWLAPLVPNYTNWTAETYALTALWVLAAAAGFAAAWRARPGERGEGPWPVHDRSKPAVWATR
ncbi:MAG TPA: hypothetical protein VF282_02385 [Bacillota bacterium]